MASFGAGVRTRPRPELAVTYNGDDPGLLQRLLPLVDVLEISPDAIARSEGRRTRIRPEVVQELAQVLPQVTLIAHGIGLSLGSFDRWEADYLSLIDGLFERVDLR